MNAESAQDTVTAQQHAYVERTCWCGGSKAIRLGHFTLGDGAEIFPLVQCCTCGVYALFPQPDDQTLSRHYSSEYYGSSRRKFIWPFSVVIEFLQGRRAAVTSKLLPPGGRLLDVGCGNGDFLLQMKRRGFEVEGTEWSEDSAARIPAGANIPVHVGDLLELDLVEQTFDLITIWHVLEHMRQPDEALKQVARLLKPGGSVFIAVPNVESRQARRFGLHWLHHDPPRHLFNFGVHSLTDLLQRTGFEIKSISTHSVEQNTFGYIQGWLNARGYPRDRLYAQLKGISREPVSTKLIDAAWLLALVAPALLISTVEAMRGQGATLVVHVTAKRAA